MSMHEESINHKTPSLDADTETIRLKIAQSVVDLHVARRTLLIYPITHEQVKQSIIRAYKGLAKIIKSQASVTLAVMKEGISFCNQVLSNRSPVLKDLAGVLKHYQIATVTFSKGLEIKELARFLQLICIDRDKIAAKGGIAAAANERYFSSIQIQAVDYSQLQLTEEQEIHRSSGKDSENGSIWQQFVSNIASAGLDQIANPDGLNIDPVILAEMINRKEIDADLVVGQYQSILAQSEASASSGKTLTKELLSFQLLIKELDADLKKQFLSATFDNCGPDITLSDAAHLIDGFGGDLIIQMIRQANSQGKAISPSLLAFIRKMGHLEISKEALPGPEEGGEKQKKLSSQKVESLLAHEQYDTYIDSGYGSLLDILTQDTQAADQDQTTRSLLEEIEDELAVGSVNAHTGRAITHLMTHSADATGYRDWARQLTYLLDDLLECHAYGYLTRLMHLMRSETRNENKERAGIASLVLDRFSDPQFVAKAIESLESTMGDDDSEALAFFMELGEPVVVEIFDGLDPNQTFHDYEVLTQILQSLSKITTQEALERLKDPNPDYVRRMIRIIRKMGDGENVQQIRSLTDHKDLNVRMEALATLLEFNNKWGAVHLQELLGDPSGEAFIQAAGLAGRYQVRSVVPLLEAVALQRTEQNSREAAIRALGRIGDPQAIITLSKIARRRWTITQKHNRRLRRVIFDSLEEYPTDAILDLLRFGFKLKDEAIQAACQRLLRKGGQTAIQ